MGNLIMTFFIAMVPIAELRAAIPFAVANDINPFLTYMIVVIGNMVPVPFIIIFIRRIFKILREKSPKMNGCITRLEKKADIKALGNMRSLDFFFWLPFHCREREHGLEPWLLPCWT